MNPLYTLVETIINQSTPDAIQQLADSLTQNPGDLSKDYQCGENVFYVLKRFLTASLARDPKIKNNVIAAMNKVNSSLPSLSAINTSAFQDFFITATDMADCKTKQQKTAYIQGKINITKAFPSLFQNSDKIAAHFVKLSTQNEHLQEELVQAVYEIVGDKIKTLKFSLVEDSNAKFLLSILLKKTISKETIQTIITSAIEQYPKESIALQHLGLNLTTSLPSPSEFFTSEYAHFTNNADEQTEDGDLKRLFYLLQIQKYFLKNVTIGPQNVTKFLSTEMAVVWLEELRVKNKHMRKLAAEITIKFEDNPDFAFEVLQLLHTKKVYLENISQNHPFAQLYATVDTIKFWAFLIELINASESSENKDQIVEEEDEEKSTKREEYLSQLEYITRERVSDLTPEQIGQTLTLLIKAYQQSKKSQKLLNLVWSLFHSLLLVNDEKKKSKKKIVLNLRGPLILSKINLTELELESQIVEILNKVTKFLRMKTKAYKAQADSEKLVITFLNFVTGLIIYCIVYPEEADACGEVEFVFKDLEALLAREKGVAVVQEKKKGKKGKGEEEEDVKKPVHVLVDVFISLLTKAPIFLRSSINLVFEQLVPFIETSDLDTLLDVILKPDQEYIEEI